jgi:mono/diheme cytochrome c family protein
MRSTLKTAQFLIVLSGLLSALAGADDRNADFSSLTGNPVYRKNCAKCHGKTAEGRHFGGPSLISGKTAAASPDDLRNVITNGKGRMPKFAGKLAAADIDQLVQQIKATSQK